MDQRYKQERLDFLVVLPTFRRAGQDFETAGWSDEDRLLYLKKLEISLQKNQRISTYCEPLQYGVCLLQTEFKLFRIRILQDWFRRRSEMLI